MTSTILTILGSILGILATWYVGKNLTKWLQAWRTKQQQGEVEDARNQAKQDNQQANSESDALRKIDGR